MTPDPTTRFTAKAEDYLRYRPSYPRGVMPLLERECGLTPAARVADIGSGTGIFSRLLLDYGCEVYGVEPNAAMRQAGERLLAGERRFHSVDGRAEATSLPSAAFDFVTAGQAFHWFEPQAARREFQRILKPGGWVVLVWNERLLTPGFHAEYDALVLRHGADRPSVERKLVQGFFGPDPWKLARLPNAQDVNWEQLEGRLRSSSYAPSPGAPEYQPMMDDLARLFQEYQRDGLIHMQYETRVFYGRI